MYKDILLTLDLADPAASRKPLEVGIAHAQAFGSILHVMTVVPDFGMSIVGNFFPADHETRTLEAVRQRLHAFTAEWIPQGLKVQHIVARGTAYEQILQIAERIRCDLIVMGANRPDMKDFLLGPNAARVVRHAECSVLVVRD